LRNHWGDDISRAHHLQFIAWHRLRKELFFDGAPIRADDRYFISQIVSALHEGETFLDGGAHHGEVSLRFMEIVRHRFSKIYAVEPDKQNVRVLRSRLVGEKASAWKNIAIIEWALGRTAGSLSFYHGLDYASQFSTLTGGSILVKSLDEMNIPATFIKLHLEGWEYDVLEGASCTLSKYRPLLTVTTYHNRNGLWMLPAFLMRNLRDYSFLMRLHSWMGTGAVVYALPHERCLRG
jgi:FkbM family methyltransferase